MIIQDSIKLTIFCARIAVVHDPVVSSAGQSTVPPTPRLGGQSPYRHSIAGLDDSCGFLPTQDCSVILKSLIRFTV